jgi:hypothetical protein
MRGVSSGHEIDPAVHRARPWRVHALARDFRLLDVWRIPIDADPARGERFQDFVRVFLENGVATDSRAANALFAIRFALGRLLRLEPRGERLPIPGATETSVAERLTPADRAADQGGEIVAPGAPAEVRRIYVLAEEALLEISNRTIHGLLHLGWIDGEAGRKTVELAIYVKSRGLSSDAYMALIGPFRHAIVYPPWIRRICTRWAEAASARAGAGRRAPGDRAPEDRGAR